jgi:hypothetical protein
LTCIWFDEDLSGSNVCSVEGFLNFHDVVVVLNDIAVGSGRLVLLGRVWVGGLFLIDSREHLMLFTVSDIFVRVSNEVELVCVVVEFTCSPRLEVISWSLAMCWDRAATVLRATFSAVKLVFSSSSRYDIALMASITGLGMFCSWVMWRRARDNCVLVSCSPIGVRRFFSRYIFPLSASLTLYGRLRNSSLVNFAVPEEWVLTANVVSLWCWLPPGVGS